MGDYSDSNAAAWLHEKLFRKVFQLKPAVSLAAINLFKVKRLTHLLHNLRKDFISIIFC